MLLILAWIVFVDDNKTITVTWALVECVCQPTCQLLCLELFVHSHRSALMTDFRWENQGSEEGSSLPQVPRPQTAGADSVRSFCVSLCRCVLFQAQAPCLQIAFAWEHPLCSQFSFSFYPLTMSRKRKWYQAVFSLIESRCICVFLTLLSLVKSNRRATQALMVWFFSGSSWAGWCSVTACFWTCWYSPLIAQGV